MISMRTNGLTQSPARPADALLHASVALARAWNPHESAGFWLRQCHNQALHVLALVSTKHPARELIARAIAYVEVLRRSRTQDEYSRRWALTHLHQAAALLGGGRAIAGGR